MNLQAAANESERNVVDVIETGIFDLLVYYGVIGRITRAQLAERLTTRIVNDLGEVEREKEAGRT